MTRIAPMARQQSFGCAIRAIRVIRGSYSTFTGILTSRTCLEQKPSFFEQKK